MFMSLYNHCKLLASIVQYKNLLYNKEVALSKETTKSYNELKRERERGLFT